MSARRALAALAAGGAALAGWGLFEAQWIEQRTLRVPIAGLPVALDGLSVLHLSDFHAGSPSLNTRTMRKAVAFGVAEQPDLVVITGDIVSHPRGRRSVIEQLSRLTPPLGIYASLGNHDTGRTRDPFSRGLIVEDWGDAPVVLLRNRAVTIDVHGQPVELAGTELDPAVADAPAPQLLFRREDSFRILLAHFPDAVSRLPEGACSLVLSGHLHGGQICLPWPAGKIRLSHTAWRYLEGVHQVGTTTLVVSRGTGTTLVPFRLFARPEVSLLRLAAAA